MMVTPLQIPPLQASLSVHALPSLQLSVLNGNWHWPLELSQPLSSVQGLLSSQTLA